MDALKGRTVRELADIYSNLNCFNWDERCGEKPPGFDEFPDVNRKDPIRSKRRFIKPYTRFIEEHTTLRERLKAWHLNHLERTRLQFEVYWIKRLYRTKIKREIL